MRKINNRLRATCNSVPNIVQREWPSCRSAICSSLPAILNEILIELVCGLNQEVQIYLYYPIAASLLTISSVLQLLRQDCPEPAHREQRSKPTGIGSGESDLSRSAYVRRHKIFRDCEWTPRGPPNSSRNLQESQYHQLQQAGQVPNF